MTITTLYPGQEYTVSALIINGHCHAKEFIDDLDRPSDTQIMSLIKMTGDAGPLSNEEKFKHLDGKIWELKTRTGVRILSFFGEGKTLILTHGFFKPAKKKLQLEIRKAAELERAYQKHIKAQQKERG
jgi:hypothetical protein